MVFSKYLWFKLPLSVVTVKLFTKKKKKKKSLLNFLYVIQIFLPLTRLIENHLFSMLYTFSSFKKCMADFELK